MTDRKVGGVPPVEEDAKLLKRRALLLAVARQYVATADEYARTGNPDSEHEMFLSEQYDLRSTLRRVRKARQHAYEKAKLNDPGETDGK
jgi:hypothetical protein